MSKYRINPQIIISSNEQMRNIFSLLSNEILTIVNKDINIINENIYNDLILNIFIAVKNKLNVYYFSLINHLVIQIYNQKIFTVININFDITDKNYFSYLFNIYNNFLYGIQNYDTTVYNNMNTDDKNNLNYSIASGDFYYKDNIIIPITTTPTIINGEGLLIKKKSCNCYANICLTDTLIVTIYWYNNSS